ncbi:sigma-70 family RNA polymerase sigma factor [Desulfosporosinus nitroreducens]|uniref:sigma-70 family RNA polymerase sigma factor n=1 Tax=Desulfosporosinus nitroreducens TaxID=2018668 RepID=UPI00207CED71|nr:sigma-70 family RNA polymerase sigma factor [Desulfosporosinus nitroreducens]MCO1602023.1 sigma-70 family RNA polymerase sigma factor [Desulfosporosinus nitroreducens]
MKKDLIGRARQGDLDAWEELIREIYPQASKQAFCLLRDKDLAQDAVQNTMLKVFNNLSGLKDEGAFTGWWRRILTNEVYLLLRFSSRVMPGITAELLNTGELSVEDAVTLKLELGQEIRRLPLEQQQILLDIDVRGLNLQEAAEEYNLPLGTVKSRLFRARARLQETLKQYRKKPKERVDMTLESSDIKNRICDYLEGTMEAAARNAFEQELSQNPAWQQEMKKQKDFLTFLHSLTGKITLSVAEIKDKVQAVIEKTEDYEEIVDATFFEQGKPTTMTSHIWFKKPDCYRTDGDSAATGHITVIIKDGMMLSWLADKRQVRKLILSQEYRERANFNFPDSLKAMAENKSSRILGTEYLQGRPVLHVQFSEQVPGLGEMNTHHWMDKETWMPMRTEYYNVKGELVNRREVRELRLNQGLPDSLFELDLPEGVTIEEENSQVLNLPQDITLTEAADRLNQAPYILPGQNYKIKHQWVEVKEGKGALLSMYSVLGEQNPLLIVTQGPVLHTNLPSNASRSPVELEFDGRKATGGLIKIELAGVKYMLDWQDNGYYYSCGGQLQKDELLKIPGKLTQCSVRN